ncbi:Alpha/Beta hydrolase protein [Geopyxis carbonaria]|nr:Alpha/Beta hydrolase protein [Geopyxis carbonaria]
MVLDGVSWLDIVVFLFFLAFQLLLHANILKVIGCALSALPFIVFELPLQLIRERLLTPLDHQSPFTLRTSLFQDFVIRCIRWGFINLPADIGRWFFTKGAALPFMKFRLMRMGMQRDNERRPCPSWREVHLPGLDGLWIQPEASKSPPDIVLLYVHGGGFAMGSCYFYLEFLLSWVSILRERGFKNPAVFALEYTLIPDEVYPVQLQQTLAAYSHVLSTVGYDSDRVVVGGDSAGGLLVLSLLLRLGETGKEKPAFATLISPWTHLVSEENKNTASDFLDSDKLNEYGRIYAGDENPSDPTVSPGDCLDMELWRAAMPTKGIAFYYGSEELFFENIKTLAKQLSTVGPVLCREDESVHAWPFAAMFLGRDRSERRKGLDIICEDIFSVLK